MFDPIVTNVVDADGLEQWGAVDAPWIVKGRAKGTVTDAPSESIKEVDDAPSVPSDGDRPDPAPRKR